MEPIRTARAQASPTPQNTPRGPGPHDGREGEHAEPHTSGRGQEGRARDPNEPQHNATLETLRRTCQKGRAATSHSLPTSALVELIHSSLASSSCLASLRLAAPSTHPPRLAAGPVPMLSASDEIPSPATGPLRLDEGGGVLGRATSSPSRASSQASPPPSRNLGIKAGTRHEHC